MIKTYLATTGAIFALITGAHIWRIFAGGAHLAKDVWFILLTAATAALSLWAWRLFRKSPRE